MLNGGAGSYWSGREYWRLLQYPLRDIKNSFLEIFLEFSISLATQGQDQEFSNEFVKEVSFLKKNVQCKKNKKLPKIIF